MTRLMLMYCAMCTGGCAFLFPAAHGAFIVTGQLSGRPDGDRCVMELFQEHESTPVRSLKVSDKIDRTITVAPAGDSYFVKIVCRPSGFVFTSKPIDSGQGQGKLPRLDLGTVQISR